MRKDRIRAGGKADDKQIKMDQFEDDLEPLKAKLQQLEESMQKRLDEQKAYS